MKRIRILMAVRLYSGFEDSMRSKKWDPSGLPSMYNFIDYFNNVSDLRIIFTAKDSGSTYTSRWEASHDQDICIEGIDNKVFVLSGIRYFPERIHRKLAMILRDLRQTFRVVSFVKKFQPDLIYMDSANLLPAAILAFFSKRPVILRVLGACSYWWSIIDSKRLVDRAYRLALRAPFRMVIGTEDGSGMDAWFDRVLSSRTPRRTLLNGVDSSRINGITPIDDSLQRIQDVKSDSGCKVITFVGRLESYKGINEFFGAVASIILEKKYAVHAVIVGSGSLLESFRKKADDFGIGAAVSFLGSIQHKYINNIHALSDIYVSTNYDGNLTNANLEAIANNQCMLIVDRSDHPYIDARTRDLLEDSVIYFDSSPDGANLKLELDKLLADEDLIEGLKRKMKNQKKGFIRTWTERMEEEYLLLSNMVEK